MQMTRNKNSRVKATSVASTGETGKGWVWGLAVVVVLCALWEWKWISPNSFKDALGSESTEVDKAQPNGEALPDKTLGRTEKTNKTVDHAAVPMTDSKAHKANTKETRLSLVEGTSERFRDVLPLQTAGLPKEEADRALARSEGARTLNERLDSQLVLLRKRRDQASGQERHELENAISVFEKNRQMRSRRYVASELPIR